MLDRLHDASAIPGFLNAAEVDASILVGFQQRVQGDLPDQRARICREHILPELYEAYGKGKLVLLAEELERAVAARGSFRPSNDFYVSLAFYTLGFPGEMFSVLQCISRMAGWVAAWWSMMDEPNLKIYRPRQVYMGTTHRAYVPIDARVELYDGRIEGTSERSDPAAATRRSKGRSFYMRTTHVEESSP